jgi:peptidoglycan/xylan/chitin deacetylase (PgdA/CDA1 family)
VQLALKIDVDTLRGTREGVPRLIGLLTRLGAAATFLFSLGPDNTGRAIRRVFRPGFMAKVSRTSVLEHYGLKTLLYGTLLPAPDISARAADAMRAARDAGFETGVHCHDHILWQDFVAKQDEDWTRRQMQLANERYGEVFGSPPRVHGAAGWQMNDAAFALEHEFGFLCASDTRGARPFMPVVGGRETRCPQLPTTLPTLDELIGSDGLDVASVHDALLSRTVAPREGHVFTLHAELEGLKLLGVLERLMAGWREQGYELVSLGTLAEGLDMASLPRCPVITGTVPGRSGSLACQGLAFR